MCFGAATLLDWNAKAVTSSYSRRETGELLMLVGERNAHAINELASRREKTAFSSVYIILADEGEDLVLRMKCAYALGMIGEDRALDSPEYADREEEVVILLCRIMDAKGEDVRLRERSAWALGLFRHSRAIESLERAFADKSSDLRSTARWARERITELEANPRARKSTEAE